MNAAQLTMTYVGGPTALLEFSGVRLLTDPTFDPAGGEYPSGAAVLRKLAGPAVPAEALGDIDYVLLSHDHHWDNLDQLGRELLVKARMVLTTSEGASRLGGNATGVRTWESVEVPGPQGRALRVVGTPARHGPEGMDRGPVTGFVLFFADAPEQAVYFGGDTVWYEGVRKIATKFPIRAAVLNLGAARVPEVGPYHLTMTAAEAVEAARAFTDARIVPLHYQGWAHFSEGAEVIAKTFASAGLSDRLRWLQPGKPVGVAI